MVVGEPQILGQIKTSYGYAAEYKSSGIILNRFLHKAFSVAKRVRTETKIASSAVSVSFAAVELAKKIFGDLSDKTVMLIGAGEMCELAAKHFLNSGVRGVMVTNRTFERAGKLAEEFDGKAVNFDDLFDHLHKADIILSSTGAPHFIIGAEGRGRGDPPPQEEADVLHRHRRPPRHRSQGERRGERLSLRHGRPARAWWQSNLEQRGKEAEKAEEIIDQEIGQFFKWLSSLEVTPTIVALRSKFEEIRQAELAKTLAAWKDLPPDGQKRLEALTSAIINKLLHHPDQRPEANRPGRPDRPLRGRPAPAVRTGDGRAGGRGTGRTGRMNGRLRQG